MEYYTMVTMFVAWGFLALFAIAGGIMISFASFAVYAKLEELVEPIKALVEALRPSYESLRTRLSALVQSLDIPALRPRA